MTTQRFDIGALRPSHTTPEGYLVCDAVVTRTGVFAYRNPDGSTRWEARHREDVADPKSLESLMGLPVVLMHPHTDDGEPVEVTPDNVAEYGVGVSGTELVELGGGQFKAQLIIQRRDGLDAIKAGIRGVSPGYRVREDRTPGELGGQRYDLAQRDIRYNHIALVPRGRQGTTLRADESAAYSVRLDESDDVIPFPDSTPPPKQEPAMSTVQIKVDGADYSVPTELAPLVTGLVQKVDALETAVTGHAEKVATLEASVATEKARADEAEAARDTAKGELDALKSTPRNDSHEDRVAWAKQREEIVAVAKAFKLDVDDSADNDALRLAVLRSRLDGVPDEPSADYVNASWAALVSLHKGGSRSDLAGAFTTDPAPKRADSDDPIAAAQAQYRAHLTAGVTAE